MGEVDTSHLSDEDKVAFAMLTRYQVTNKELNPVSSKHSEKKNNCFAHIGNEVIYWYEKS